MRRTIVIVAMGAAVVAALVFALSGNKREATRMTASNTGAASAPPASVSTPSQDAASPPAGTKPAGGTSLAASKSESKPVGVEAPAFDVVRVERGSAVLAGRAPAGSKVTILDGQKSIGEVIADSRGEWVLTPQDSLRSGDHELGLSVRLKNGRTLDSERIVVVVVPEEHKDIAGRPATAAASPALAMVVPRTGSGPSKVLQAPSAQPPVTSASVPTTPAPPLSSSKRPALSVDVVDYDEHGRLILSGRGAPDATVLAYLDNRNLGRTEIGSDGQWRLSPETDVASGRYTLRVDELSRGGQVVERIALPFSRAAPEELVAAAGRIVVQPGNSLWRIARHTYGEGLQYTVIYETNKSHIKDPDLIYPGQVFLLPKTN